MRIFLALALLVSLALPAMADADVEALLRKMTLEEKIGQMTLFSTDWESTGPSIRSKYQEDIRRGRVGAIFNAYTPEFTRSLQKIAVEETRLHVPLLFGYDVIHGHKTIFPIPLGEACSWDLALIEKDAHIAATEAAADGLHWAFAPMVDIARDPRWGRVAEGAGEDVFLGQAVARARVRGFQGKDLAAPDSLLACAKHFAAYGAPVGGRDYNTVDMSRRELLGTYMPPYRAAVDAGVATVMTSFNELDGVPSTGNAWLLRDQLRDAWGFQGFVVTDYTSINEMINHGIVADLREAAALAANAGVDMDMQGAAYLDHLADLVRSGRVSMATVDEAVRRILRLKAAKGLFADPYRACDSARAKATLLRPEHLAAAREAARASIVLLKNQGSVLPLRHDGLTVALVGPLADDRKDLIGCWSGAGDGNRAVSVREGIAAKQYGVRILTAKGCDFDTADRSGFAEAVAAARQADVVVAVVGESAGMSGEAASRASLDLPGVQRDLLAALKQTGKPLVVVLMNGRPLTLGWEDAHCDAIVEAWHGGTEAGPAIADVLFGDYNPGGRLVMTFPRVLGQVPIYYGYKNTGRPVDPANKYSSKYLDAPNDPLYPFGYGLSYTTFAYGTPRLSRTVIGAGDTLEASVDVTNSGARDGEEVVQLYVRDVVGSVTRPVKELKGFQKVRLRRGETRTVTFRLSAADLAFWRRDMTWGSEPGEFRVWIAPNAASGSPVSFTLR